ncbi:LysR family transcriptional regulator [Paracoccus sp. (in: a-proteobacteria)]|uniref:LysR family transcriptional regulator n=1 Tax=Paracoccus sp. TaxID=267 RepID=UPI00321F755F
MELKWLEDFIMLANTASFSRAAQARNVTQSAFSRRIKQLESWAGAPLISRATIPAELTAEGRAFLPFAQETLRSFQTARESLGARDAGPGERLTLASLHTLSVTVMPEWIERIATVLPGLRTRMIPDRGGIEDNLEALVSGEADLFSSYAHPFVPVLLDPGQFDWITLGHEAILPVIAPALRTPALPAPATCADFLAEMARLGRPVPYLDHGPSSFIGTALARLLAGRPLNRHVVHEHAISVGLRAMALRGWGLCWLPERLVQGDLAAGRLVPASGDAGWRLDTEIRLYRYKGEGRSLSTERWQAIAAAFQGGGKG